MTRLLTEHQPRAIVNFAAESHVDRSIRGPGDFVQTNIVGTFHLLEACRGYWDGPQGEARAAFSEAHRDEPNSPYPAIKAASDHLLRAWHHTCCLSVITTNCSNNYGPYHFPEKLIPLMIGNALAGKPLPIHGDGMQVRDWLFERPPRP